MYLGVASYQFAKLDIISYFVPVLKPIAKLGILVTLGDMAFHYKEATHYPVNSEYYLSHIIAIGVDIISVIPVVDPIFAIYYFWLNTFNNVVNDQEIPNIIAESIYAWKEVSVYIKNGDIKIEDVLFEQVESLHVYGGRH